MMLVPAMKMESSRDPIHETREDDERGSAVS